MNEKLSIQSLADSLSEGTGVSKKVAETFTKAFFDTIVDALYMGEEVIKVKGLGVFKLVEVESRESVNVSNGERIVIPGYKKVTFVPDEDIVESLNQKIEERESAESANAASPNVDSEVSSAVSVPSSNVDSNISSAVSVSSSNGDSEEVAVAAAVESVAMGGNESETANNSSDKSTHVKPKNINNRGRRMSSAIAVEGESFEVENESVIAGEADSVETELQKEEAAATETDRGAEKNVDEPLVENELTAELGTTIPSLVDEDLPSDPILDELADVKAPTRVETPINALSGIDLLISTPESVDEIRSQYEEAKTKMESLVEEAKRVSVEKMRLEKLLERLEANDVPESQEENGGIDQDSACDNTVDDNGDVIENQEDINENSVKNKEENVVTLINDNLNVAANNDGVSETNTFSTNSTNSQEENEEEDDDVWYRNKRLWWIVAPVVVILLASIGYFIHRTHMSIDAVGAVVQAEVVSEEEPRKSFFPDSIRNKKKQDVVNADEMAGQHTDDNSAGQSTSVGESNLNTVPQEAISSEIKGNKSETQSNNSVSESNQEKANTTDTKGNKAVNVGSKDAKNTKVDAKNEKVVKEEPKKPVRPSYYIMKKGESLTRISVRFYGTKDSLNAIVKLNRFKDPNNVPVGAKVFLP